jgi:hypothetical protein
MYMEIPQTNSLYCYLYLKETKMSCFPFYLFSSAKSENRREEQVLQGWVMALMEEGMWQGKG